MLLHDEEYQIKYSTQAIEDYYGENTSIYFEFISFYQWWLIIPAFCGSYTLILTLVESYM